jgi:hypothetical protein
VPTHSTDKSLRQSPASRSSMKCSLLFYRALMYAYPPVFRARFAQEMTQLFRDAHPGVHAANISRDIASLWLLTLQDFARSVPTLWWRELREAHDDVPAWMISVPVFALAAIVLFAEGGVAAALTQKLTFEAPPNAPDPLTRVNLLVSSGLALLAWAWAFSMARRRALDFVVLKCTARSNPSQDAVAPAPNTADLRPA